VTALATAVGGGGPGELGLGRWHLRSLMAHGLVQCTWAKANQTKLSGVKLASHQMAANTLEWRFSLLIWPSFICHQFGLDRPIA